MDENNKNKYQLTALIVLELAVLKLSVWSRPSYAAHWKVIQVKTLCQTDQQLKSPQIVKEKYNYFSKAGQRSAIRKSKQICENQI